MVLPYGKLTLAIVIVAASLVLVDGKTNESEFIYVENLAVDMEKETEGMAGSIPHLNAANLTAELEQLSPEEEEFLYNDVVETIEEIGGEKLIDTVAKKIAQVTKVDGKVSEEEKAYLLQIARDLGHPLGTGYIESWLAKLGD
jgi:tellurite resistance protein